MSSYLLAGRPKLAAISIAPPNSLPTRRTEKPGDPNFIRLGDHLPTEGVDRPLRIGGDGNGGEGIGGDGSGGGGGGGGGEGGGGDGGGDGGGGEGGWEEDACELRDVGRVSGRFVIELWLRSAAAVARARGGANRESPGVLRAAGGAARRQRAVWAAADG